MDPPVKEKDIKNKDKSFFIINSTLDELIGEKSCGDIFQFINREELLKQYFDYLFFSQHYRKSDFILNEKDKSTQDDSL